MRGLMTVHPLHPTVRPIGFQKCGFLKDFRSVMKTQHNAFASFILALLSLISSALVAQPITTVHGVITANGGVAITISLIISGVMTSIGFYMHLRESLVREERLKAELATARYDSLKAQMNPHFLFNSLNVLSELVLEDAEQAVDFIQKLSQSYRYVLDSGGRQVVPLQQELDFVQDYAKLVQTRFEDGLELTMDVTGAPHEHVPPLALQLLLENAVKHNVVRSAAPMRVEVFRKNQGIVVINSRHPKQ